MGEIVRERKNKPEKSAEQRDNRRKESGRTQGTSAIPDIKGEEADGGPGVRGNGAKKAPHHRSTKRGRNRNKIEFDSRRQSYNVNVAADLSLRNGDQT